MKTYKLGNDRVVTLSKNKDELCIKEKNSQKSATFTPTRWASFLLCLDEIDSQLDKMFRGEEVSYRNHYGGGWHVSVTSGFQCVDLRKFYIPFGEKTVKPTKTGIALRLTEWAVFKEEVQALHRDNPIVANFVPCFLSQDHTNLESIRACRECNPFPSIVV